MAKFKAIIRLSTKLMAKIFAVTGGGSSLPKPFDLFQAARKMRGEYQTPPSTKAEMPDVRIAQMFRF